MESAADKSLAQRISLAEQLFTHWEKCTRCELHELRDEANGLILPGNGWDGDENDHYPLMIVVDRFDPSEIANYELMTGPHSVVLTRILDYCQVTKFDVWTTAVTMCPTGLIDPDLWRKPELMPKAKPRHITACRQRLHQEIHILQPTIVIAMGALSLQAVTNSSTVKFTTALGQITMAQIQGDFVPYEVPVMTTHSPSDLLRNVDMSEGGDWHATAEHFNTAFRLIETYERLAQSR